jgi:squalene-associated FAD-dependent desaturase
MMHAPIHIIGAGVAGLSAAVRLAERGRTVIVHDAAPQAGGRCRSYYDATLGLTIDNGNHLLLSGNRATLEFVTLIGARDKLTGADKAEFHFTDLATGERWRLNINDGLLPVWLFYKNRRVPGTRPLDYLGAAPLMWAGPRQRIADVMKTDGALYHRLWHPLMLAALNTEPADASAKLAGAIMRETLAKGGHACHPLTAVEGLSSAFVDPAIQYIEARGGKLMLGHPLRALQFDGRRVTGLQFEGELLPLEAGAQVILAVPAWIAPMLVPGLTAPTQFRSIVNAHFRITPPANMPQFTGVINSVTEWVFAFPDRISITISGADRLLTVAREQLAYDIWREVSKLTGLAGDLPPWQIIREKRATFAALPEEDAKRPGAATGWENLVLAGDWTQTGLPATIEGAIRSGERAAKLVNGG